MPLGRIEIEEIGPGRWVAEIEAGGSSAVRRSVRATSFDDIILAVVEAHAALTAPPAPPKVVTPATLEHMIAAPVRGVDIASPAVREAYATTSERAAAESAALAQEVAALPALNALRERAAELGIDVDGRWREPRLRAEIERAERENAA